MASNCQCQREAAHWAEVVSRIATNLMYEPQVCCVCFVISAEKQRNVFDFSGCSPTVLQKKPVDQIKSTNVPPPFLGRLPLLISAGEPVDRKWIRPRHSELSLSAGGGLEPDGVQVTLLER